MYLDKYIEECGAKTDYPIFENENHKDIIISPKDLFLAQYKGINFNAIDIVVKYLAIENYYGINSFGFELYNKMQLLRTGNNWDNRFIDLIKSVENNYDFNSRVETDLNYSIHDGAHRTALALFHNQEEIPIRLYNTSIYRRSYDMSWFYENVFTEKEIKIIEDKFKELLNMVLEPYYCILWPPARNSYEEIEKDINKISNSISVTSRSDIQIDKDKFRNFIYKIYATDDIKKDRLDKKYEALTNSLKIDNYDLDKYLIRILKIKIEYPYFRVKPITGLPQSTETMKIKQIIRDTFKPYITEYYYDIIMHVTDNAFQNKEVKKILENMEVNS